MQALFDWLGKSFQQGSLTVRSRSGETWTLGQGEPHAAIRVESAAVLRSILLDPELRFGETYMEGGWEPDDGCSLLQVLEAGMRMVGSVERGAGSRMLRRVRGLLGELNDPLRSRRNVSRHYDLDRELYTAFLDRDLHYSCAYFREPGMSLEAAQQAKCAHIAAKLDLAPGARVLDVGCGWGGLAMYLAQHHGARVTGITLSEEQLAVARERVRARGLEGQVDLRLEDYRRHTGRYDAVVSVGMFEHVGRPQYGVFFERLRERLEPGGTALLHTIGRSTPPGTTNRWIRRYIFPGGYIPAASEVQAAVESQRLLLGDLEVWRLHYATTLAEWHRRFQARRAAFRARLGERFCRMWEFYLQASEAGFRRGDLVVLHFQLLRDPQRLPLTRDYLYASAPFQLQARVS